MSLRTFAHAGVNLAFRHLVPNRVAYLRHRLRHRKNVDAWADADFYFIHIPKCAGTSFVGITGRESVGHVLYRDLPPEFRARIADKPHLAILRDPVDRLASVFKYAHRTERSYNSTPLASMTPWLNFSDYITQGLRRDRPETHYFLRPASLFLEGAPRDRISFVNFQRLEEGIAAFMQAIGRPFQGRIPRDNVSEAAPDLDMTLTGPARAVLEDVYAEDFRLWRRLAPHPVLLSERLERAV